MSNGKIGDHDFFDAAGASLAIGMYRENYGTTYVSRHSDSDKMGMSLKASLLQSARKQVFFLQIYPLLFSPLYITTIYRFDFFRAKCSFSEEQKEMYKAKSDRHGRSCTKRSFV